MTIEEEVLKRIKPSKEDEEKLRERAQIILDRLKGYNAEIEGSFRKGTWLKGDTDIDIFVFFPKSVGKEYLREKALKELIERFRDLNYKIAYAEHPYLIVYVDDVEIDVVPALSIESGEEAITAADRTPFHTKYVISHLDEKGRDEVRLLKRFLKGIGVYGAEIKVKGFSGYVTELLIIYYGSFKEVLRNASKFRPPVRIELVRPKKEFDSPLIVPDPVDPKRNASSAVSLKSLATFALASKIYLEKPSMEFFFPSKPGRQTIKGDILLVKVKIEESTVEDIIWGQVWRNVEKLKTLISHEGYRVIDISAWGDAENITIGIQLESKSIGEYYLNVGPYFYLHNVKNFIEENENVWIGEDGRLYSIKRRRYTVEEIIKRNLSFKQKFTYELQWLTEEVDDPWINLFLRKTPSWLK
ncbi:CCA tRNA nucleotidyltransferase [Sulfurisphaera tokodaii]|uniref:CCA-adding enzyme n=2 Tax=Sulfurisphaera tokodaii TaxID=111955 RepID=CCA_SULTO|nr:CCA tRNA nucleotidyltransferase [Sulfurisphaera tokodaii]Q973E7.1 RecName: Full=CCA-adding enzyme; AltName: Full=CCA tRNA nucleotidyltransferase; AltName: Full=tRNA CCA-pyrophosphorylase; AltName: Full=tRNA adenylyl-/cytidylyl- transferase; AltName: Full=tRNA nucleotidyltransferase; AltName: Full=tRNA-NT [Sulfurisphaera tokodaii str. 7]BAK54422.1 CCA-adding enzyme [Sulfurisphaera tokodaii str. 7]HII73926.1 CCA tRNA nucleotidyltransferase [Sulfurisphaera tokodaii]